MSWFAFCKGMAMHTDRRFILTLIAMGRITPAEAERLLAAWDESRETAWILAASLAMVCLAQLNVHSLTHLFYAQISALAEVAHQAFLPITGSIMEGW